MAGDIDHAASLAPTTGIAVGSPPQRLARLVQAVSALADGRNKEANDILEAPGGGWPVQQRRHPAQALRRRRPATPTTP